MKKVKDRVLRETLLRVLHKAELTEALLLSCDDLETLDSARLGLLDNTSEIVNDLERLL